jgi:hypothetical protein
MDHRRYWGTSMHSETTRPIVRAALAVAVALTVAACTSAGGAAPTVAPSGSPEPQPTTVATGPGHDFYLRVWQTQALAPQYTIGWLPQVTIADGRFYDGMIMIPAIYPGPIYTGISSRSISAAGIAAIAAEADNAGLLDKTTTFGTVPPGGVTCHVTMIVAGVTHELSGACAADDPLSAASPGTAQAFGDFVSKMQTLPLWLAAEMGDSKPWDPDSIVVLASPPTAVDAGMAITPGQARWPLAVAFSRFGSAAGSADIRCAVVSGGDMAALLPAILDGNALTRYTDSEGVARSLIARPLLPGEPSLC